MATTNTDGGLQLVATAKEGAWAFFHAPRSRASQAHRRRFTQTVFVLIDVCVVWLSALIAICARFSGNFKLVAFGSGHVTRRLHLAEHFGFLLLFSVLVVLFCNTRRLYRATQVKSPAAEAAAVLQAIASAAVPLMAFIYLSGVKTISRLVVGLTLVMSAVSLTGWRYLRRRRMESRVTIGRDCRNVLILGTGKVGQALERHLMENKQLGYVVKGFLGSTQSAGEPGWQDGSETDNSRILGSVDELPKFARAHFIDEIFITVPNERELVKQVALEARRWGVQVRVVPDLYDGLAWGAPIEYLGQFPTMSLHQQPIPALGLMFKRIIDIFGSAAALILLFPLIVLIAVAIRLDSRGPILYRSVRIGKKGKTFVCYKFRSMIENADGLKDSLRHLNQRGGVLFKLCADPRITRVGRFLRKYSLDELPQLWNVLKGDMSLVGPRPPIVGEYEQYSLEHLRRLDVFPGITGLWQVEARRDPSFESYVSLDISYIEHWNLWLDLKILLKTVFVVVAGTGQ